MVPMCWDGTHVLGWRSWLWCLRVRVGVEELAMVPICWGGGAGCGTHVLGCCGIVWGWRSCMAVVLCWGRWRSWLWYPCVGVEELQAMHNMVPMCWTINTVYLVTARGGDQMVTAEGRGSFPPPMQRDETLCQSLSLFIY